MLEQNKKLSIAVIALAVVALVVITVWQPSEWTFRDTTDYDAKLRQSQQELAKYQEFLATLNPDYESSQQLLKKIATEELVRAEIEASLNTKQKIIIPQLSNSEVKIVNRTDAGAVEGYLSDMTSMVENYRAKVSPGVSNLYAENASAQELEQAKVETTKLVTNIRGLSVPTPLVELHKANIISFQEYGEVFDDAEKYAQKQKAEPWSDLYQNYAVIDNRLAVVKTELERINKQYALAGTNQKTIGFPFIKTAQAQFGSLTIISADLERQVMEGIKEGLAKSFAQFAMKMLDKLVTHIEKNFSIASQLYYSNELARFYSIEYMQKFVEDPLDQEIIKNFLPEYFCIAPDKKKLKEIFVAKAREELGNDIAVNPNDPDWLLKLARVARPETSPIYQEGYYESLAAKTAAEAETASAKEVVSPGFKTGRDLVSNQVNKTVAAIFNVQEAAISGAINLGTNNASSPISQMVAGVVESMVNKFIFTPIAQGSSSGGVGVLQEKNVCLKVPEIKPLIPVASSEYKNPAGTTSTAPPATPPFTPRN